MTWQLACWITIALITAITAVILISNRIMLGMWVITPDAYAQIVSGSPRLHAKHKSDTGVAKIGWRALKRV